MRSRSSSKGSAKGSGRRQERKPLSPPLKSHALRRVWFKWKMEPLQRRDRSPLGAGGCRLLRSSTSFSTSFLRFADCSGKWASICLAIRLQTPGQDKHAIKPSSQTEMSVKGGI